MIIKFSTNRDINGNRYFLGIDTEKKIFSRESAQWYCRDDIIQITKKDRRKLIDEVEKNNFTEVNYI